MWIWLAAMASTTALAQDEIGLCGYRALLFAAQRYADPRITDLDTPNRDIELVASVLRERYGFVAETVPDASRARILDRLERLRSEVRDCDAVIVYYAGHGELDDELQSGFWLPVDARHDSKATWISNHDVASRVKALPARHVLLVADSCFAGSLFRGLDLPERRTVEGQARATRLAARQSRTVVTSGGEEPVADKYGASGASVFAYFLHQRLTDAETRYVTPDDWFGDVRDRVMDNAHQQPRLGRLFGAGHEGGSLVMVNQQVAPTRSDDAVTATVPRPSETPAARIQTEEVATPPEGLVTTDEGVELVRVPAGSFLRGSGQGAPIEERPQRPVTIRDLLVMRQEVTQGLWTRISGQNPSHYAACGERCPVEGITWSEAVTFANALSKREGLSPAYKVKKDGSVHWRPKADGYRLLTEAEWEYVARGGRRTTFAGGDDAGQVAWTRDNSGERTHPVCTRPANPLGLCDLSGNVAEWVWDWYAPDAYATARATDPTGPERGTVRSVRGGAHDRAADAARVSARSSAPPTTANGSIGLRLARRGD